MFTSTQYFVALTLEGAADTTRLLVNAITQRGRRPDMQLPNTLDPVITLKPPWQPSRHGALTIEECIKGAGTFDPFYETGEIDLVITETGSNLRFIFKPDGMIANIQRATCECLKHNGDIPRASLFVGSHTPAIGELPMHGEGIFADAMGGNFVSFAINGIALYKQDEGDTLWLRYSHYLFKGS